MRLNPGSLVLSTQGLGLDYSASTQPMYVLYQGGHSVVKNRVFSSTAIHGPSFEFGKTRGTVGSETGVEDDDRIGIFNTIAYDGNGWQYPASILFEVDGAVSTGVLPARITFATTSTNTGGRTSRFRITSDGTVEPGADSSQDFGSSSYRWDDIYATNSTIQTSDERLKTNISGCDLGLDFIDALEPKSYKWKDYTVSGTRTVEVCDDDGNQTGQEEISYTEEHTYTRKHYGMIAQDVLTTISGLGIDSEEFAGIIYEPEADRYGLRYQEFMAPMIKAIQELKARVEELESI
jgi:hypothetical protein